MRKIATTKFNHFQELDASPGFGDERSHLISSCKLGCPGNRLTGSLHARAATPTATCQPLRFSFGYAQGAVLQMLVFSRVAFIVPLGHLI